MYLHCPPMDVYAGGEQCTRWGLLTHTRHYYFPLRKSVEIGLDVSDIVKANKLAINYLEDIKPILKVESEPADDDVVGSNVRFKLMDAAVPKLAREICKGEGMSLPAFHSKYLAGKIVPIMEKHSITQLLVVAKFTDDKVFLVKDVNGREVMIYHRKIATTVGEKAAGHFEPTSETGELDEVAIIKNGNFEMDMTTAAAKKDKPIKFLCQYTDSVIQSQTEMNAALTRKAKAVLKLIEQLTVDLKEENGLAEAEFLVELPASSIETIKAVPSDGMLVLIEYLEKLVSEDNRFSLVLTELDMITSLIENIDGDMNTDRGVKMHIKITDELKVKLDINQADELVEPISYSPKTKTLEMGDWVIGGTFHFAMKSINNAVIVQDFRPFWYQNVLLESGYFVISGRRQYLTHMPPEFLNCNLDSVCFGDKYVRPTLRELQCAQQVLDSQTLGVNYCREDQNPPPVTAYRTSCRPPSNTIISKRDEEVMMERLCGSEPSQKLYFYKEQTEFTDNCRLRFYNHEILGPATGAMGSHTLLGFDKILTIDRGLRAVQENVWYQIAVYGGIGLVASCISTILTYVVLRSKAKNSQPVTPTSAVLHAAKAVVDSLHGSVTRLNDNLEDQRRAQAVTENAENAKLLEGENAGRSEEQIAHSEVHNTVKNMKV